MSEYILITGAGGGIGKAVVRRLLQQGYEVFGCDIRKTDMKHKKYHGVVMDVTSVESIQEALKTVTKITDRLYAVINTAGIMYTGSLVEENPDRLDKIVDGNLLGMFRVNQIFFPLIEKGHGRILNFSSEYGKYFTSPFSAYYMLTKHAVESYSDGLRRELAFLGIPVISAI